MHVNSTAFSPWIRDELIETEALLTDEITMATKDSHHALANRALIRAHRQDCRAAIDDAKNVNLFQFFCVAVLTRVYSKSIRTQPSVMGYIALAIAHIRSCERDAGFKALDFAFKQCYPSDLDFLLLIKAIILYVDKKYDDAMTRVHALINATDDKSMYYSVLSQMYFLHGIARMEQGQYEHAIQCFERAQVPVQIHLSPQLEAIMLMFRWNFDGLGITVQRCLCEALYAVGRTREAAEALLKMISTSGEEVRKGVGHSEWVTDFMRRCIATFETEGDTASSSGNHEEAINQYSVALSLDPTAHGLFLKRSKARALKALWEDALRDANKV
ncbi:hypothetical protein J3R82DRAFT_10984 [Butyriboletus roseoflavus]|nr:hypothetical protein J3R82DRAFT_10984 [Butyriboletus roseoflavus]